MSQARLATDLTNDAVLYALAASLAFLAFAVLLDPKLFRAPVGRSLIVLDAGLVALYVPAVLHRFFGLNISSVAFAWFYLGVVVMVGTAVWVRTWIMIRAQARGKANHPPPGGPGEG